MNSRFYKLAFFILLALVVGVLIYFSIKKPEEVVIPQNTDTNTSTTTPPVVTTSNPEYRNNEFGFRFRLPESWEDYSVIEDVWEGNATGQTTVSATGTLISLRHPDWEYKSPRQDIPIMVFTISQWNDLQADKFHIGAAPVNPTEMGRNTKYVFALPARYNFEFLTGYEEVEGILEEKPLSAF